MSDLTPHVRRARAAELGRDPAVTEQAIQRRTTISPGAEPVLTLGELAVRTGAPLDYLRAVVGRGRDPYLGISRPKRNGTTRPIASPEPVLKDVQRWILDRILGAPAQHLNSWAYQSGKSVVECARQHRGARWLIKLDVHDFFGSVDDRRVFTVFASLGYPRLLSFELARLCTRQPIATRGWRSESYPYRSRPRAFLPQGAPTSGALANIAMTPTDAVIARIASKHALTYSRYSDDLVLSSAAAFSRREATATIAEVAEALARSGFAVHKKKTVIAPPGARKVVLGLLVRDDGVYLTPEFRRRIETHLRGVAKFGVVAHTEHRNFRSAFMMIEHVYGCIAFAEAVEPTFGAWAKAEWTAVIADDGYPAA